MKFKVKGHWLTWGQAPIPPYYRGGENTFCNQGGRCFEEMAELFGMALFSFARKVR